MNRKLGGWGIFIVIIMVSLYSGCTNPPPEEFWQPSSDDTLAVLNLLQTVKEEEGDSLGFLQYEAPFTGPTTTDGAYIFADDNLRKFSRRVIPSNIHFEIDSVETKDSLLFSVLDTTCTAYVIRKFTGKFKVDFDSVTPFIKDSIILNDTIPLYAEDSFMAVHASFEKELNGESWQAFFFTRDSTGKWEYKKKSGALYFFPGANDAPGLYYVKYTPSSTGVSEYIIVRPFDTAGVYSYGMYKLYSEDELRKFSAGEVWTIEETFEYPPSGEPMLFMLQM